MVSTRCGSQPQVGLVPASDSEPSCGRFDEVPGGFQASLELTFSVEAQEKPACVAEALFRFYA